MGIVKNTGIIAGGLGASYLGLETLKQAGHETAGAIQGVVDDVASGVVDTLGNISQIQINDFAPLSDLGISELAQSLTSAPLQDFAVSGGFGVLGGYLGRKATNILGKITNTESESDNRVGKFGAGISVSLGTLGAITAASAVGAGATGYILGKKLSQTVLKEEHAKIVGYLAGAAATTAVWGVNSGTVLGTALVLGGGKMIWDTGKPLRERNRAKIEERKRKRAERRAARKKK